MIYVTNIQRLCASNTGFNPNSLKIPQIKKILVFHNVSFPSSAKKAQLVEIFKAQISKNSSKLLAEYSATNDAGTNPIEAASLTNSSKKIPLLKDAGSLNPPKVRRSTRAASRSNSRQSSVEPASPKRNTRRKGSERNSKKQDKDNNLSSEESEVEGLHSKRNSKSRPQRKTATTKKSGKLTSMSVEESSSDDSSGDSSASESDSESLDEVKEEGEEPQEYKKTQEKEQKQSKKSTSSRSELATTPEKSQTSFPNRNSFQQASVEKSKEKGKKEKTC